MIEPSIVPDSEEDKLHKQAALAAFNALIQVANSNGADVCAGEAWNYADRFIEAQRKRRRG